MTRIAPIVGALLGTAMAVACVAAQAAGPMDDTPNDKSLVMSKIDTDNDGTVSLDEALKAGAAKFDMLDTDKEGTLDKSELTGIIGAGVMKKADPDKDGTLDKNEYLALVKQRFQAADTDKDGSLDARELSTEPGRALVALLAY